MRVSNKDWKAAYRGSLIDRLRSLQDIEGLQYGEPEQITLASAIHNTSTMSEWRLEKTVEYFEEVMG